MEPLNLTLTQVLVLWVAGFGALSLAVRERVVRFVRMFSAPRFVLYCALVLPLVLVEERLTCETQYVSCISVTIPAFMALFAALYGIDRLFHPRAAVLIMVFGAIGWANEFIAVGRVFSLSSMQVLVLSPLAFAIYAVLAIIPVHYLVASRE